MDDSSLFAFGLVAAIAAVFVARYLIRRPPIMLCTTCGFRARPRIRTSGSLLLEIVLWLFILPGIFYSWWRGSTRTPVCRLCGSRDLVPLRSAMRRGPPYPAPAPAPRPK